MKIAKTGLPKKYAKMGFKKGWQEYKKSKRKRKTASKKKSKPRAKRRTSNPKRGNPNRMTKRKRTIPLGRVVGTAATGALMVIDAIQPNPVVEAALAGDFVTAAVNFATNVRTNYHPARLFANSAPALLTNVAGGILDKMKMNKSVEVAGYRFKGL